MYYAEPQALFVHGNVHNYRSLIMSLTLDRKVATGLFSKATTGNDLLSVLEMITNTFVKPTNVEPTLEEIEF